MQKKIIVTALLLFISILLHAQTVIQPSAPDRLPDDYSIDSLPFTEINIPITVNLQPLYKILEANVDTLITSKGYPDEWIQQGCDTRYKYTFRRSPLKITVLKSKLNLAFTGYYKIVGSTRGCINGVVVTPWTPPCTCGFNERERRVNISFDIALQVINDYSLRLTVVRNAPEPLDKCEVCFWKQDITNIVIKSITTELDAAKKDIESEYGKINLKPQFLNVWNQLNQVYHLPQAGYLKLNPSALKLNAFEAKNNTLNIALGVHARPVVAFTSFNTPPPPLPNFTGGKNKPGFSIFLDALMNYDSLSVLLNKQIAGMEYNINKGPVKRKFILESCTIKGVGKDKIAIQIKFGGTRTGYFYLIGQPWYDVSSRTLLFKNIEFDVKSKDALLKTADWIFSNRIEKEIEKKCLFSAGEYIDLARQKFSEALSQPLAKGIYGKGAIQQMQIIQFFALNNALVARAACTGEFFIRVNEFSLD